MMAFKGQNMSKYHGQAKRFFKKKGRKEGSSLKKT